MELLTRVAFVAAGGALGAVARYLVNISPLNAVFDHFPLPTFLINVSGSFLIGLSLILLTDRFAIDDNLRLAIIVGFLGAFTTFSTFEMEIYGLAKERYFAAAIFYLVLSTAAGFAGVVAGIEVGKKL